MAQLDLFNQPTGEQLRDQGISRSINKADREDKDYNWSGKAFEFLKRFIKLNSKFMTEDIREAAKGYVPDPPNQRAWGGVIVRAKKEGLIKCIGIQSVKNPNAHCANANIWIAIS